MTMTAADIERTLPMLTDCERAEIDRLVNGALPFGAFVREGWPVLEPATKFVPNWHIDAIAEHLEAMADRQIRRLLINIPPRCMKSLLVSVFFPAWVWTWKPSERFLSASYAQSLAIRDAVKTRRLIASLWYQQRWAHVFRLTSDQNEKHRYENDQTGYRIATSVGGAAVGEGGDCRILDDPNKPLEVHSETIRESILAWVRETWSTRSNDPRTSTEVIIMQRLHERDVSGYVLAEMGGYEHLMLPARFDPERRAVTCLGWSDPRTAPGELLWPARIGEQELATLERALGSYGSAGQLQQRPSPAEGGIIKIGWFRFWTQRPTRFDEVLQSWDMAFKDARTSSYVVGQIWGRLGADLYLLDQYRAQVDFLGTVAAVRGLSARWPQAQTKLVEAKANGPAVVSTLQHELGGFIAVPVSGSKEARAAAVGPIIEAGNVYLPDMSIAPWINALLAEVQEFPNGSNDDQVDALTQALDRMYRPAIISEVKISGI